MNSDELLFKLGNLDPDTPLTAKDLIAVIEALKPVKSEKQTRVMDTDAVLSTEQVADWIGESVHTLEKWRVIGGGPKFIKKPKNIGYKSSEVKKWLDNLTVSSTAEFRTKIRKLEGFMFASSTPLMIYGDLRVDFFESLAMSEEPDGFLLVSNEYYDLPQNNLTAWIADQLPNVSLAQLLAQVEEFIALGGDLNQVSARLIGDELQTYTTAHVLATYEGNDPEFPSFATALLEQGMKVDIANNEGQTALDIHTNDLFRQAVNAYNLHGKLQALPVKETTPSSNREGGKL